MLKPRDGEAEIMMKPRDGEEEIMMKLSEKLPI
jgi:hypothetical protein